MEDVSVIDTEERLLLIPLEFITSLICEGSSFNLHCIQGVSAGAIVKGAGISEGNLVLLFDREVPEDAIFRDLTKSPYKTEKIVLS